MINKAVPSLLKSVRLLSVVKTFNKCNCYNSFQPPKNFLTRLRLSLTAKVLRERFGYTCVDDYNNNNNNNNTKNHEQSATRLSLNDARVISNAGMKSNLNKMPNKLLNRNTMYLLTEWMGRTETEYLARGHDERTERSEVRAF